MIKFQGKDIKDIKYKGQSIKKVMYKGHQIYPAENIDIYGPKYFGPICYWNKNPAGGQSSLEQIEMRLEGGYIRVSVNNGGWYFICEPLQNQILPTLENPCIGINDNGSVERKYDLFFSQSKQCWVWNNTRDNDSLYKFRYISLSTADAERNKSTNLAGLQR